MKTNMFIKTFLMLLVSFTLVFFLNAYISNQRFSSMYLEENIEAVKSAILDSQSDIENSAQLDETELNSLSSETTFILYRNYQIEEEIGPNFLDEDDIIDFVIVLYDNDEAIVEDSLTYFVELKDDVYHINYIYEYEFGEWMIVSTKIQSLTNVDQVLTNLFKEQIIYILLTVLVVSVVISLSISRPLKKINKYAKQISNLNFKEPLNLKRNDEFREINTSLNEMTFNLKKTYEELDSMNNQLSTDLDQEKVQEKKKKDLIMTINHEIKTPLAVIRGMVEGMIDGVGRYKNKEKYLEQVIEHINKIERITQDLNYSLKLEDKMKQTEPTSTTILEDTLTSIKEYARSKKTSIKSNIITKEVNMSKELLEILFTNIVKNSILYTTDKKVSVDTEIIEDLYVITITNKGHIEKEDANQLFNSFYRGNSEEEGTGLGLYIVKQICNLYNYEYKIFNDNDYVKTKIKIKCH